MNLVKKSIPIKLALCIGLFMWFQHYIPHNTVQEIYRTINKWGLIIAGFAMLIGTYSLLNHHWHKIKRRTPQWGFSIIVYVAMFTMVIAGFGHRLHMQADGPLMWLFRNVQVPMQSTMFSILAFYIVSAAYRAFRARTREATILLITAIIVMLGRVPIGEVMFGKFLPNFTEWLLNTPSMAAQRGILLGVGLAIVATALRVIFGIERTYMGGGGD